MDARTAVMGDWGRVVRDPTGEIKGVGNLLVPGENRAEDVDA